MKETNRRDFLKGTAWMGAAAIAAGCHLDRLGFGTGGTMQGFALKPMKEIRVGFVGIGSRGSGAVHRVAQIPGCRIVALCDLKQVRIDENREWLKAHGYPAPREYCGPEAYKGLCDFGDCDVIYCATPWNLHQPVALRSLLGGKIPLVEVTSALTVDGCWELVEASEKYRIPCMQLENCVYFHVELLELYMVRLGLIGEVIHAEGGYLHDLRCVSLTGCEENPEWEWRYDEMMKRAGNSYPTHGLVPPCLAMDINRGDRLDYLVSVDSMQASCELYRREVMPDTDPRKKDPPMAMGDINSTIIRTKLGKTILLQHDTGSPRPYSRLRRLQGTKGIIDATSNLMVAFEEKVGDGKAHKWIGETFEEREVLIEKYKHPLWRQLGEIGKKVGGHGGMDFIMDVRWAYCLQNGLPLDMDVYDLASTSCICELTELSARNRGKSYDIPDFTRGGWRTAKPFGIVTCDQAWIDRNFGNIVKDESALNV